MFNRKIKTYVDDEIQRITFAMQSLTIDSKEYSDHLEMLTKLQKIRQEEKPDSVSMNNIASGSFQLAGILLILHHEHLNVISSKALALLPKLK